jgi:L-lactate dehydrogenase
MTGKVGIVGTGAVGMAAAYSLFQQRVARHLVLVDRNHERAEGEARDLEHGQALVGHCQVEAGDWDALADSGVVVICAGAKQNPGETRLQLLERNAGIFADIAEQLDHHAPDAVVIIASNPVDVLTRVMQRLSKRPHQRIIGTGTMLDTSRFRASLGDYYDVNPRSVHAYILGEHGDSEVPLWSDATIGGLHLRDHCINGRRFDAEVMDALFTEVRDSAYHIIQQKGYTNHAIGLVIAYLIRVIQDDQRSVLPVSVLLEGQFGLEDVCMSLPCVLGSGGLRTRLEPEPDARELDALRRSGETLRGHLAGLDKV